MARIITHGPRSAAREFQHSFALPLRDVRGTPDGGDIDGEREDALPVLLVDGHVIGGARRWYSSWASARAPSRPFPSASSESAASRFAGSTSM